MKRLKVTLTDNSVVEIKNVVSYTFDKENKKLVVNKSTGDEFFSILMEDKFDNVEKVVEVLHNKKLS